MAYKVLQIEIRRLRRIQACENVIYLDLNKGICHVLFLCFTISCISLALWFLILFVFHFNFFLFHYLQFHPYFFLNSLLSSVIFFVFFARHFIYFYFISSSICNITNFISDFLFFFPFWFVFLFLALFYFWVCSLFHIRLFYFCPFSPRFFPSLFHYFYFIISPHFSYIHNFCLN